MRNEKGFALILTLIVTALMVAALVEMIHQVTVDISLSRGFRDGQQASLMAESGAIGAMKLLQLQLQGKSYSALTDTWATPVKLDDETGTLDITVTEESGRINLNCLVQPNGELEPFTQAALKRLGNNEKLKIPEDTWNALADWLDSDDQTRSYGAETPFYQAQKPPYKAHNGKLATIRELSLVNGFTPDRNPGRVAALWPYVTVYADQPGALLSPVNINTAEKEVLMALDADITSTMADSILTERLKPFETPGQLSRVSGAEALSQKLVGKISVKGNIFRIRSIAKVKESTRTVEAVMRLSGEVLSWQEY